MRSMLRVALEGAFTNFKRIFFAADRVTDMDLRNQIATLSVEVDDRVDESACIGCAGCANVCPTNAIEMKNLASPVKLTDDWVKNQVPEINLEKCIVCYYCHDFCPVFSLYGQKGTIHPNSIISNITTKMGTNAVESLLSDGVFSFPKPVDLVKPSSRAFAFTKSK